MAGAYPTPGVYYEPRPRAAPRAYARTDVVGFVGFESRVRDGTTPSRLAGDPPTGHAFRVDVAAFQLPPGRLGPAPAAVPAATDLVLSEDPASIPVPPGGSVRYAVAAAGPGAAVRLVVGRGPVSATDQAASPTDADLTAAAGGAWVRIADVLVVRAAAGADVLVEVIPALPPARCDDWADFELQVGGLPAPDDGTYLARAVRMFFANGGGRCHVATARRPRFDDPAGRGRAVDDFVGTAGASEAEATGLERLLRIPEVAVVDAPDLYARRVDPEVRTATLPPLDRDACFRRCGDLVGVRVAATATGAADPAGPVFADAEVLDAQRRLLARCGPERWRVLLLLAAPVALDPATGRFRGPAAAGAAAWRRQLENTVDDLAASACAFYHPWVLAQERVGAEVVELPPTPLAAGVLARRDLARGPHVAAANERLVGVVGLSPPADDDANAALYEPPVGINPLRAVPGLGVYVWGARTLSADRWLRYLPVRRCLSAVERRVLAALRPLVFEPNTPALWFQVTRAVLDVLVPVYDAGALRGDTPDEAYYVRCDDATNPPEAVAAGQVLCEVGVAVAAPAEFIVFRVGRREAVVEVLE